MDGRACVRPWTATGLGIFESTGTDRDGSFIITGGHNTGGFAQAPAVAMAVLAAIERRSHPMHTLYHPKTPGNGIRAVANFIRPFYTTSPGQGQAGLTFAVICV